MSIDLEALLKQSGFGLKEIVVGLGKLESVDQINKGVEMLWKNKNTWKKKDRLGVNDVATLSEDDWKKILQMAKARCEELGGTFTDPTGTWSF